MNRFFFLFGIVGFFPLSVWCESWVIIANGNEVELSELKNQDQKVLVLDGAANRFKELSFYPDVILGDFDSIEDPAYWGIKETFSSISENSVPYIGNFSVWIVPAMDQNHTDLEKAIIYCDAAKADSILIVQATGGRMDHTLGNLGTLRKYYRPNRPLVIQTEDEQIFYLKNEKAFIEGGKGENCAVMGYPKASMTTVGLAYNGYEYPLELGICESTCNALVASQAVISICGEALIILPKSARVTISKVKDDRLCEIDRILREIWSEQEPFSLRKIEGGLTNENYVVDRENISYFIRCSGHQNGLLGSSLEQEWIATSIAGAAGLAPKTYLYIPEKRVMISEFLKKKEGKIDLRCQENLEAFCKGLRALHRLEETFPAEFCPFECIDTYLRNLRKIGASLPLSFLELVLPKIGSMKEVFKAPIQKVPCHLDLHEGNLLDDGKSIYFVDWEYSAMGDPLFDLATTASADYFSDAEMQNLLQTYLEKEPSQKEWDHFYGMRILADIRWALWAYLQSEISSLDASFKDLGDTYLEQCLNRIKTLNLSEYTGAQTLSKTNS